MRHDDWRVGKGIRPAGKPDECFYCGAKKGAQHNDGCVCRLKTVVILAEIELVREVPEHWDQQDIEFSLNEGGWCSSNFIRDLEKLDEAKGCLCNMIEFEYVREASMEDEQTLGVRSVLDAAEDEANT